MTETAFYIFAVLAVLGAAMCVLQRTPVAALMWLVETMFALAAIFLLLGAEFIAAIQVLVYAGAILVLFLFIIMLLNLGHTRSDLRGAAAVRTASAPASRAAPRTSASSRAGVYAHSAHSSAASRPTVTSVAVTADAPRRSERVWPRLSSMMMKRNLSLIHI